MVLIVNLFTFLIGLFILFLQLQTCFCAIENKENKPLEQQQHTNKKLEETGKNVEKKEETNKHSEHQNYLLFRECAVKERIKDGEKASKLHTIDAYSKMKQIDRALFFSISNNVYIGSKSLANKCIEDKHAKTFYTKFISETNCKKGNKKGVTKFTYKIKKGNKLKEFILSLQENSEGKCVRSFHVNDKKAHHFEFFECKGSHCGQVKMVLVERDGKNNKIRSIFYSKSRHSFECLEENKCGKRHFLKGVYPNLQNEKGVKLKQNKLFQECAVKRGNNIETLVKHIELSSKQILFFSKGEHVYFSQQQNIKENCEKDKTAKMRNVKINHIELLLENGKIKWKNYKDFNLNKKLISVVIKPNKQQHNKQCSAYANNHFYQIFLCQKEVCGSQKLYLMRKNVDGNSKLIKMDEGEKVHLEHIFIADLHHSESKVIGEIIKRCEGTQNIIDGVSYSIPNNNKQHPKNKHSPSHKNNEQNKKDDKEKHLKEQNKINERKGRRGSSHQTEEKHEEQQKHSKDKSKHEEQQKHSNDKSKHEEQQKDSKDKSKHEEQQKHPSDKSKHEEQQKHSKDKSKHEEQQKDSKDKSKHEEQQKDSKDKSNVHEQSSQQKHDENDKIIERKGRVGSSHQTESKQHEQQKHFHQSDKEEHLNASNQKKEQVDIKKEEKNNMNIEGILKNEAGNILKKQLGGKSAPI